MHPDPSILSDQDIPVRQPRWKRAFRRFAIAGLAAASPSAIRANAQRTDPTPTSAPLRVAPDPTPTPEPPGNLAAPPTPTPPPSIPEPDEVTPTPEPIPPSPTPAPVDPTPTTAAPPPEAAAPTPTPAPEDPQASVFPWNPFCGPGPFGPWYPVVAPPDITSLSGIRWYGLQPDTAGGLVAAAFDEAGEEVSRCEVARDEGGGYQWSMADGQTRIEASFAVERDGPQGQIVGEVAGQPFAVSLGDGASPGLEMNAAASLDEAGQRLVANWSPVVTKTETMFSAFVADGVDPAASPGKCFASGFLLPAAILSCPLSGLGCAAVGVFGGYIWNNCTD